MNKETKSKFFVEKLLCPVFGALRHQTVFERIKTKLKSLILADVITLKFKLVSILLFLNFQANKKQPVF